MENLPTIDFISSLAREMGEKILPFYGKKIDAPGKDINIHIEADVVSEKVLIQKIREKFPSHLIFSEETANIFQETDFAWIVDPLDGTINFSQGIPFWTISIGLRVNGEIVLGAVYQPLTKEMFTAKKDEGAYLNGEKISVSKKEDFSQAVIGGDSATGTDMAAENIRRLASLVKEVRTSRIFGGCALALAYVACGRLDAYFHNHTTPFDVAAGSLLVKEAGGLVTKINNGKWDIFEKDILAGTPAIHRQIVAKFEKKKT